MSDQRKANEIGKSFDLTKVGSENAGSSSPPSDNADAFAQACLDLIHRLARPPLFELGRVVATAGALDLLDRTATNAGNLLQRHQNGDFGNLEAADMLENLAAIEKGFRILSAYHLAGEKLWIITESDRSVTTLLLPSEY